MLVSAKRLKSLIEHMAYEKVPEAIDQLFANIFFPVCPIDVAAATR
jgi:hypothetical protein